jgi:glycosyltransferase involved in cell wall biosynthesis
MEEFTLICVNLRPQISYGSGGTHVDNKQNLRILFACVEYGTPEKVYFERQADAFETIEPVVATWRLGANSLVAPVHQIDHPWSTGWSRRWRELGGRMGLDDAFGTIGSEKYALTKLTSLRHVELIYAHTGFMGLRLLPLKRATGLPLAVHFHGLDLTLRDAGYQKSLAANIHNFDRIFVVGKWMEKYFLDLGFDPDRLKTIPMGAPVATLVHNTSKLGRPEKTDKVTFIVVGRLTKNKGIDRTIRTFGEVAKEMKNVYLKIVGSGEELRSLKIRALKLPCADRITFAGALSSDDTIEAVTRSDVLVLFSQYQPNGPEAFGVCVTEAMALAKPVIGSRVGGLPDQIVDGETGILVPHDREDNLKNAMLTLATHESMRKKYGHEGQRIALMKFDSANLTKQVEQEFQQLLGIDAAKSPK